MKRLTSALMGAMMLLSFGLAGCDSGSGSVSGGGDPQVPTGYNSSGNTAENNGILPNETGKNTNTAVNEESLALMTVEQLLKYTPMNMLTSDGFDEEKFFTPFYQSQIQYNEGFFLLEDENGEIPDVKMAFEIAKVLEVRSNDLKTLYTEGKDYEITEDGKLSILEGSKMTATNIFTDNTDRFEIGQSGEWKSVINTTDAMYRGQYTITYIREEAYEGYVPESVYEDLTTFKDLVEREEVVTDEVETVDDLEDETGDETGDETVEKKEIEMIVVGDSIVAGAGPQAFPKWTKQLETGIEYYTGKEVNMIDGGIPGIHTGQYVDLMFNLTSEPEDGKMTYEEIIPSSEYTLNDAKLKFPDVQEHRETADLVVISIGANDAGGWCGAEGIATDVYKNNVQRMINYFRDVNPECSILLVSCMQTNPKVATYDDGHEMMAAADLQDYENALASIVTDAQGENIGLARVHSVESSLLNRKKIEDMLGDNINHPSDYMSRVYTQVVLDTLLGDYKNSK